MKVISKLIILIMLLKAMSLQAKPAISDWFMEAESTDSKLTILKDGTIDIIAPKGLTLWNKKKMKGNVRIEYDARIVVEENNEMKWNRLSDLNCFWMATDPSIKGGSVLKKAKERRGIFINQYALSLYYVGYGGNYNKTTRFRRYDGNSKGITDVAYRPAILREYTDSNHLLKPNHWYHIILQQDNGHVRYWIDGECIVDYLDTTPLTHGYFGFRTTLSHAQLKNFSYSRQH